MLDRHEVDEKFVEKLEWQIGSEVRRRNRALVPSSPMWRWARVAAVVTLSMGLGAAAMAASYQIGESWRQELLEARLDVRLDLAQQRLALAGEEVSRTEAQFATGAIDEATRDEMRLQLAAMETHVQTLALDLEEVRAGGREPLNDISAPLVAGRDFVSERIELELEVIDRRLAGVARELERVQARVQVGAVPGSAVTEVESALRALQAERSKLDDRRTLRRAFLAGEVSALEVELQLLHAEAEQNGAALRAREAAVATEIEVVRRRVEAGAMDRLALGQLQLHLAEIEGELRLAMLEQELIQREIEARRR